VGVPAAKMGDTVTGVDIHIIMIPSPGGPVPTPLPHPFNWKITGGCITSVTIGGQPAAVVGSTAMNAPPHIPQGSVSESAEERWHRSGPGSPTVLIGGKPAAKAGDQVMTCNDPAPAPTSAIVAVGTVLVA